MKNYNKTPRTARGLVLYLKFKNNLPVNDELVPLGVDNQGEEQFMTPDTVQHCINVIRYRRDERGQPLPEFYTGMVKMRHKLFKRVEEN